MCRRITGSSSDADDATQEALIKIVRNLPRFDGRSAFTTWAFRIATNAALDELRKRSRRPSISPVSDAARDPADDRAGRRNDRVEDRLALDAALGELSDDFRAAVVLRDVVDLDYREIAEILDIPVGTVKSRIARGRSQLAATLRLDELPPLPPLRVRVPDPGRGGHSRSRHSRSGHSRRSRATREPHRASPTSNQIVMNEDLTLLASAYLDGDAAADERARDEPNRGEPGQDGGGQLVASDAFRVEVERLRQIRAVLSERESPLISTRERHLATALDAWDRIPSAERSGALHDATPDGLDAAAMAGAAALTVSTSSTSKRPWYQSPVWLGAAAAGLVIVMAGGLILRSGGDDEPTSADSTTVSAGAGERVAEEPGAVVASPQLDAATAAAPTDTLPTENASDVETDPAMEAPPADDGELTVLTSRDDLADFAAAALTAPSSADLPDGATVVTDAPADAPADVVEQARVGGALPGLALCLGADRIVGPAEYNGVQVIVGIDDGRDLALAYLADCSEVARASLR